MWRALRQARGGCGAHPRGTPSWRIVANSIYIEIPAGHIRKTYRSRNEQATTPIPNQTKTHDTIFGSRDVQSKHRTLVEFIHTVRYQFKLKVRRAFNVLLKIRNITPSLPLTVSSSSAMSGSRSHILSQHPQNRVCLVSRIHLMS